MNGWMKGECQFLTFLDRFFDTHHQTSGFQFDGFFYHWFSIHPLFFSCFSFLFFFFLVQNSFLPYIYIDTMCSPKYRSKKMKLGVEGVLGSEQSRTEAEAREAMG